MKLTLHHGTNVDLMYGQGNGSGYWKKPKDKKSMRIDVATFAEAAKKFRDWIERNGLGSGNLEMDAGEVEGEDGRTLARVSHNGRIWTPEVEPGNWRSTVEVIA